MRRPSRSIFPIIILCLLAAAGGAALFVLQRAPATPDAVHPRRGQAIQAVYATGTVEPTVMIPIAPRTGARLAALSTDEGQTVAKGAQLARLEDDDLKKTLEEAEIRAVQAQKDYTRRRALGENGAVSLEETDRARAEWRAAKAAMGRARANLNYMKLTAPEAGTIIRRDGEIGEMIPANQPIFWMSCCAGPRVTAEVDEEDIAQVQVGQKVAIRADAFEGRIFDGTVASITPKGDPVARSYRVRITLDRDTPLMAGMTAETNIIIRVEDNALLLPAGAVQDGKVWVVKDGHLQQRVVEIGARTAALAEIRAGLDENDIVIRDAAQNGDKGWTTGDAVRPRLRPWTPEPD